MDGYLIVPIEQTRYNVIIKILKICQNAVMLKLRSAKGKNVKKTNKTIAIIKYSSVWCGGSIYTQEI